MGYPLRRQIAGGVYHLGTRGTGPSAFFRDADDRVRFLRVLRYVTRTLGWRVHSYCLMVTHYHLVATTPEAIIARAMQLLNSIYARTFNARHGRIGHLVAARYSGKLIETDDYALEVCRYVPLNPVRSGLCARPEDWLWSSYAATIGQAVPPDFLDDSWVLDRFDDDPVVARQALRAHVEETLAAETRALR